jgi:hypothetical protein
MLNILLVSFSTSLIVFLLYLRITRKVYIIELNSETIEEYNTYFIFLILMSVILMFLCFILIWKKKKPNKFLVIISKYITKLNIFYYSYVTVFNFLGPQYTQYLLKFATIFLRLKDKTKTYILVCAFILPKLLIVTILVIEIYNKQLNYYYYALLLLLIPLFFRFLLFILDDLGPRITPELKELLIFENEALPNDPEKLIITIKMRPEVADINIDYFLNTYYYPAISLTGEMAVKIMPKYSKITLITSFIYHSIHFLSFLYVITFI